MATFKKTVKDIKEDFIPSYNFKKFIVSYLYDPRFRLLLNYRMGNFFFNSKFLLFRQIGSYYKIRQVTKRGCDISYSSFIGKKVRLPHPIGIVIGYGVIIKDNVKIFQQVTIGSHGKAGKEKSYPVIEENVIIYAGAKIIGNVIIGKNSIVGANALVNIDVPENSIAVGIPCTIKKKSNN